MTYEIINNYGVKVELVGFKNRWLAYIFAVNNMNIKDPKLRFKTC